MWRVAYLIPVLLLTSGAAPPARRANALESYLAFANPQLCELTKPFNTMLERLIRVSGTPDQPEVRAVDPVVPAAVRSQFGKAQLSRDGEFYTATVPVNGTWHGLKLRAIESQQILESEGGFAMTFEASSDQVRSVLNRLGFGLDNQIAVYRDPDGGLGISIELQQIGNSTVLTCFDG
jgi:hypothetical protein